MNPQDPLAQLRDIHLPDPVSLWPPAPGWIILGVVVSLALFMCLFAVVAKWRSNRYKREALRLVKTLEADAENEALDQNQLSALNSILRRVSIKRYPNEGIQKLTGTQWLAFLDQKGRTREFTQGPGQVLGDALFQVQTTASRTTLMTLTKRWIKQQ